ncbi:MAG TPA: ribose-phosphate diphosphokinase [Solirubrobacteraceae bacterium]|nr:ribose-phosphate diphosphokinase [Solirubrobacteraceae bacterium]
MPSRTAPPLLAVLPSARQLVPPHAATVDLAVERFADGEAIARLHTAVRGHRCVLAGASAPPDEQLTETLLAAHALRRAGAAEITAVLPYLAYGRQDAAAASESLGLAWLGELLQAAGVTEVVAVDVHSAAARALLPMPVASLSPAVVLAHAVPPDWRREATFAAPDEGALERARAVARVAGVHREPVHFVKRRTAHGVRELALIGEVRRRAVLVDDILATGGTLVAAARALRGRGAEELLVLVTHGLFAGGAWRELWELGVGRIVVTDTVPLPATATDEARPIDVVPVWPLIAERVLRAPAPAPDWRRGRAATKAARRLPPVVSARAKSFRHGKSTADKWNQ